MIAGAAHLLKPPIERLIGASDFLHSFTRGFGEHSGLLRQGLIHDRDLTAQIPGESFQRLALCRQTLRQIAGIVCTGIRH